MLFRSQYLRDEFKSIDYLTSPTGGIGYKLLDSDRSKLGIDAGVGGVWEKNTGRTAARSSGAISVGEKLSQAVTATTTVTQTFTGLWKTQDMADALYTFGAGVSVSMSTRTQLKVELLDTFKSKPPAEAVERNDVALLIAVVYKM